mmetsp:Transcript_18082/g.54527  ORF Transcript_18082/g.54527 Transcript_18082/m.54527 type:complete len:119 (-) Transcript_18082:1410-1766(-)
MKSRLARILVTTRAIDDTLPQLAPPFERGFQRLQLTGNPFFAFAEAGDTFAVAGFPLYIDVDGAELGVVGSGVQVAAAVVAGSAEGIAATAGAASAMPGVARSGAVQDLADMVAGGLT